MEELPWFGPIQGYAAISAEGALTDLDPPKVLMVLTQGG